MMIACIREGRVGRFSYQMKDCGNGFHTRGTGIECFHKTRVIVVYRRYQKVVQSKISFTWPSFILQFLLSDHPKRVFVKLHQSSYLLWLQSCFSYIVQNLLWQPEHLNKRNIRQWFTVSGFTVVLHGYLRVDGVFGEYKVLTLIQ